MSDPNVTQWEIDKLQARDWLQSGSVASVWASNWAGDSIAFDMTWHPDGFSIVYNIEVSFYSEGLVAYLAEDIINDSILSDAETRLSDWWKQVIQIRKWVQPADWNAGRGMPSPDFQYAALAFLYTLRAQMFPLSVTQLLSEDMSVPASTTKERIRKSREKDFLTSPGKGLNGRGELTNKATKTLRAKGIRI
jgi:hypothetical protein